MVLASFAFFLLMFRHRLAPVPVRGGMTMISNYARPLCVAALLFASAISGNAASQSGTCNPTKIKFKASDSVSTQNTVMFKTITDGAIAFVQGGTAASCVVVLFDAGGNLSIVRAKLDNFTTAIPTDRERDGFGTTIFIFPSVAPGAHTLRIQLRSHDGNIIGAVSNPTIIVHSAP